MNKTIWFVTTSLFAGLFTFFIYIAFIYKPTTTNPKQEPSTPSNIYMDNWYTTAETPFFKIFYGSNTQNKMTVVLDKRTNKLYTPDNTCEVTIPEATLKTPGAEFYNKSIGILDFGAYKQVSAKQGTTSTFVQHFLNGGCAANEGEIILSTNPDGTKLNCDVKIKYEFIGC